MNLFRSEEHVNRWSLYHRAAEDYVMSVADWAKVFSSRLFRNRLDPDYLEKAEDYLTEYHAALKEVGKASPLWQYPFIADLDVVKLSRYQVVGNYTRYEERVLNTLKDARQRIVAGIEEQSHRRENYLIWAAPGSGKTYFARQIAESLSGTCRYVELNLAKLSEQAYRSGLSELAQNTRPSLALVDEIDAKPDETWPYEVLLPYLDSAVEGAGRVVFVVAGSSGFSLDGMKQRLASRPKGSDLLSRIPVENQIVIPQMSFGDRVLVVLSQFMRAGNGTGRDIRAVEKLGLYYIALASKLTSARQLHEFAIRAAERGPRGDDRVKYDHLFAPGDPENKRFWLEVAPVAEELINRYVIIED